MRLLLATAPLLAGTLLASTPALAQTQCVPVDTSARILASASPNDVHPDWADGSYVGLSWTFEVSDRERTGSGLYFYGDVYSPDGALVTEGAYVKADEWDCGG